MKPAPFDYVRAETVEEVLAVLASEGSDAQIIAGGQSLMPMLNTRLAKPKVLIDIMRLKELDRIDAASGAVTVGAAGLASACRETQACRTGLAMDRARSDAQPRNDLRFDRPCGSQRGNAACAAGAGRRGAPANRQEAPKTRGR